MNTMAEIFSLSNYVVVPPNLRLKFALTQIISSGSQASNSFWTGLLGAWKKLLKI